MNSCLLCEALDIEEGAWLKVYYNSARSDDEQTARGKITSVDYPQDGSFSATFIRKDGQKMEVQEGGRLISYNSHHPTTGYCYRYDIKTPEKEQLAR